MENRLKYLCLAPDLRHNLKANFLQSTRLATTGQAGAGTLRLVGVQWVRIYSESTMDDLQS